MRAVTTLCTAKAKRTARQDTRRTMAKKVPVISYIVLMVNGCDGVYASGGRRGRVTREEHEAR